MSFGKNAKKFLAGVLALTMLVGCSQQAAPEPAKEEETAEEETAAEETATEEETVAEETVERSNDTLVVGYSPFNEKFSPFFASTAYDRDVADMTQVSLLSNDRAGAIVFNGIEGETVDYNGTDYTYTGPANIEVVENEDGTVDYNITLRDDIVFSDGEPMTIDDVIFSYYVQADPTYDGSSTLYSVKIDGMDEYRSGMSTLFDLIKEAGRDNTDFTYWDEATQTKYWESVDKLGVALVEDIEGYLVAAGYNAEDDDISVKLANWGFEVPEGATPEEAWGVILENYEGDFAAAVGTEAASISVDSAFEDYESYLTGVETGDSAANIKGIVKTGDYSMTVHTTEVDAKAIYSLGVSITPMHYYGEADKYDYDNNKFGFDKGDLSHVRSVTTKPLGAGPYKFVKYENGVVNFEANENYYKGTPKIKYVNFLESSDKDKTNGVIQGTIDVTDPSFSQDTVKTIEDANGGELNGDVVTTSLVKNLGYGYIGINANRVNVGGAANKGSDASKNLRKAFGTIYSLFREVAISSYYGERASIINYPISDTSWAAPKPADPDYEVAFSKDVEGNPIYTSDMDDDAKEAAAKAAALGFLEAAGYTVEDGKVTAAPEGAKLEYDVWIPADGNGDHPSFMILTEAREALADIGMKLNVTDLAQSTDLWDGLDAGTVDMWCAAWGATLDPDMTQIYFFDLANSPDGGITPGPNATSDVKKYNIADAELDTIVKDALKTTDQAYRKVMYKAALDIVVDWADEIPIYQRENCVIFSTERVNVDTITPDITTFYGWMAEIQNTEMK